MATSIATTNGKQQQEEMPPLPDHYEAEAKSFFSNYQHIRHQLSTAQRELGDAQIHIAELDTTVEGLRSHIASLESRMISCVLERDQAVAARAERETILLSISGLLEQAGVRPNVEEPAGA